MNLNPAELQAAATITDHSGLVLALLLPVWLSLRPFAEVRTRQRCEALLPAIGLNVLAHFWLPLRDSVPFAGSVNPEHLLAANGFVLGLAGALTADGRLRLGSDEIKDTVKRFLIIGPLSLAGAITAVVWPGGQTGLVPGPWWSAVLAAIFVVGAIAILAFNVVQPSIRALGFSLAALVALDLAITFVPNMPSTPRALLFPGDVIHRAIAEDRRTRNWKRGVGGLAAGGKFSAASGRRRCRDSASTRLQAAHGRRSPVAAAFGLAVVVVEAGRHTGKVCVSAGSVAHRAGVADGGNIIFRYRGEGPHVDGL